MFGLFLFILFAPGVSEFLCASSDLEMSYTFCGKYKVCNPFVKFVGWLL